MLELGRAETQTAPRHRRSSPRLDAIDVVHCVGPLMKALYDALPTETSAATGARPAPRTGRGVRHDLVDAGDVVLVKGSKGIKVAASLTRSANWARRWNATPEGRQDAKRETDMLYWLTELSDGGDFFNLFRYITFRAGGAFVTALVFGFLFGRPLIDLLRRGRARASRSATTARRRISAKAGTPTMGGLLILGALLISTLLWARLDNPYIWIVLLVTLAFGLIGFADDYAKVTKQNTKGVSGRVRMLARPRSSP